MKKSAHNFFFLRTNLGKLLTLSILIYPLSLINQIILSWRYGVSTNFDTYWICYFFILLITVPLCAIKESFSLDIHQKKESSSIKKSKYFSSLFNALLLASILIISTLITTKLYISTTLVPNNSEAQTLCIRLIPILSFAIILLQINESLTATLTLYGESVYIQLGKILGVIGSIISVIVLGAELGILAIAWGILIAALCASILNLVALHKKGICYRPFSLPKLPSYLFTASLPFVFYLFLTQGVAFFLRFALQSLSPNAVSGYQYAFSIYSIPENIITFSLHGALWSYWGSSASKENKRGIFIDSITIISFILGFATLTFTLFNIPIVKILFMRGNFEKTALIVSTAFLKLLAWTLIPQALSLIFGRYIIINHSLRIAGFGLTLQAITAGVSIYTGMITKNVSIIILHNAFGGMTSLLFFMFYLSKKESIISSTTSKWVILCLFIFSTNLFLPSIDFIYDSTLIQTFLLFSALIAFFYIYYKTIRYCKLFTSKQINTLQFLLLGRQQE